MCVHGGLNRALAVLMQGESHWLGRCSYADVPTS
jgi:hypothetical protein